MRLKPGNWRFSDSPTAFLGAVCTEPPGTVASRKEIPSREDDGFIGAKEAAAWLGIPLRSLYQYVRQGLLPCYRLGRHRLFRKQQLLTALGAGRMVERSAIFR